MEIKQIAVDPNGGINSTVLGLGADNKIYAWNFNTAEWREFWHHKD